MAGIIRSIVAAVAANGVIGIDSGMPWHLSTDMKRFKSLTMGNPVVMGRKTFETIGKPLAGRVNIVISRQPDFAPPGVTVAGSLPAALIAAEEVARASGDAEVMIIGGGMIYAAAMPLADRLYITHVEASPEGTVAFPPIEPSVWHAVSAERYPAGPRDSAPTTFAIYERLGARSAP